VIKSFIQNIDVVVWITIFTGAGLFWGFLLGLAFNEDVKPPHPPFEIVEIFGHRFECREAKP